MKFLVLALSLGIFSNTFAKPERAGGPVKINLSCKAIRAPKNLSVRLELLKAAVSPQYNLRGATLIATKFDPANGHPQTKSILTEKNQTAYNATFAAKGIVVEVEKSPLSAIVKLGIAEYSCN